jgi:chemotaxis protein methyltransferase CheR
MVMEAAVRNGCFSANLSTEDFTRLGSFIQTNFGIKMSGNKKVMVESRLRKRLRQLDIMSYTDYCEYLFSKQGLEEELVNLIDVITTNKTDFFREPDHFHFLHHSLLPEMINGRYKRLSIWSAACSTGEEPYSIAMAMEEFSRSYPDRKFDYTVFATDISSEVINKAKMAMYHENRIENMPVTLKKNYLLRARDKSKNLVRIIPELRKKVRFRLLNLMDDDFKLDSKMDIIFCRNVIIYFDRKTQEMLLKRICRCLKPTGFLFMGHSEVLAGLNLPLKSIAPTVYKKME